MSLFQELNSKGKTIAFVTHESDIAVFTNRTIMLRDGNIVKDEKIKSLSAKTALNNLPVSEDYDVLVSTQNNN
jgi:putative ABC transport system ATP-binding protein